MKISNIYKGGGKTPPFFLMKRTIKEGISKGGTPDLKYYAFDWDDNVVTMPTKIILKNEGGDEIGMSTSDFATYRSRIGKEPFNYKGDKIVGFGDDPFVNFRTEGDKKFIIESMLATPGPSWGDFMECINNGSIFAIITARGHTPSVLKEAVYNYIVSGFNGIDKDELIKNLIKFRHFTEEELSNPRVLIRDYLDLCRFYPVSYGTGAEANPEEAKIEALEEFTNYVKDLSRKLQKQAYLKNKVLNNFIPQIGFSDDDLKNVEAIKKHFKDKPDNIVKTYLTKGGEKKRY